MKKQLQIAFDIMSEQIRLSLNAGNWYNPLAKV